MEDFRQLVDLVQQYSGSTILTVVGLMMLLLALTKLRAAPSHEGRQWKTIAAIGLVIILGGQSLNVWNLFIDRRVTSTKAFSNLKENARVNWVVRLIAYNPDTEKHLHVRQLSTLGPEQQMFVFVADYDELKGYTVEEAIYKTGNSFTNQRTRVSGIIFPLNRRDLFPASVRGLVQVVQRIDENRASDPGYKPFRMVPEYPDDLKDTKIGSYAWDAYKARYGEYNRLVDRLRVGDFSATKYFGSLNSDWHPLGYSKIVGLSIDSMPTNSFSLNNGRDTISLPDFGARAFLIQNARIEDLDNVILLDFKTPQLDRIPDLGGKTGKVRIAVQTN